MDSCSPSSSAQITERLTEDQCILTNLTAPLHCVMLYEVEHFNGQLNLTLEDMEDRIVNLLESLENVTGVPLPPDVDTSTLEVPTADPSSRNENPGAVSTTHLQEHLHDHVLHCMTQNLNQSIIEKSMDVNLKPVHYNVHFAAGIW